MPPRKAVQRPVPPISDDIPPSPSPPRSRSRSHSKTPDQPLQASHLVNFLDNYEAHQSTIHSDDENASDNSEDEWNHHGQGDDHSDDSDPDDDGAGGTPGGDVEEEYETPSKRNRMGLVGSSSKKSGGGTKRKGSTSATPTPSKRRKVGTTTPSKSVLGSAANTKDNGPQPAGIIRPSKSDVYFTITSKTSKTSGHSYSNLVKPLSKDLYERYSSWRKLSAFGTSTGGLDEEEVEEGLRFDQWEFELEEGFNLLFYGFGSKRRTLNRLVNRLRERGSCVVVNGHFPGLGIKEVLNNIEEGLGIPLDIDSPPGWSTPMEKTLYRIWKYHSSLSEGSSKNAQRPLYLVLHNIDSPSLRAPKSLSALALLASSPHIHICATFDHVHSPLLFSTTLSNSSPHLHAPTSRNDGPIDPPATRGFNWLYHNLTTFDDYDLELSYQRLSTTSLSSLTSTNQITEEAVLQILQSVPPMAIRLLKILLIRQSTQTPPEAVHHIPHPVVQGGNAPIYATDIEVLQRVCKEKFVAREEERFGALVGEYKDHGVVVETGLDNEGRQGRWVWVPLGKGAVLRILEGLKEVDV